MTNPLTDNLNGRVNDHNIMPMLVEPVMAARGANDTFANNRANAPIGVFDSGVGGLSVAMQLYDYAPQESIVYYADSKHVPYGDKSDSEILTLTAQAVDWLYRYGCKAVVVACNTASAFSLTPLRDKYGDSFPIIGLVPAVKPAVLATHSKHIGVLATQGTMRGQLLKQVIADFATPAGVTVHTVSHSQLVPWIEAGLADSEPCKQALLQLLTPLIEVGVDQLVLGCTHYPFLRSVIHTLYADKLVTVDSGRAVAKHTLHLLSQRQLLTTEAVRTPITAFISGDVAQFAATVAQLNLTPYLRLQAKFT